MNGLEKCLRPFTSILLDCLRRVVNWMMGAFWDFLAGGLQLPVKEVECCERPTMAAEVNDVLAECTRVR